MMFTSGLAADILFTPCVSGFSTPMTRIWQKWAVFRTGRAHTALSLGSDPVGLLCRCSLPLASCFMCAAAINRNTPKPAARSRKNTDGLAGTLIDLMAVFALLAGTTTTFTLATPLMSQIVSELFGFSDTASSPSRFWQSPAWYIPFPSCVA